MKRKIVHCRYTVESIQDIDPRFADDVKATWLVRQAQRHTLTTFLAHADDGVIWGYIDNGKLALSGQVFKEVSPALRSCTLQQARLFGQDAELLIWRDGDDNWRARSLKDEKGIDQDQWCFDEHQLQWGDHQERELKGFTLVAEGQEGLRHAVPLPAQKIDFGLAQDAQDGRGHPIWLKVRHYLERDEDGMLFITQSRLVELGVNGQEEGSNG